MFRVTFQGGLPISVAYGSVMIGENWGLETADRRSFFTPTESVLNCVVRNQDSRVVDGGAQATWSVTMAEGSWSCLAKTENRISEIYRFQELTCDKDSLFQDFIMRFRILKSSFPTAFIGGKLFRHEEKNIWHQFDVTCVELAGAEGRLRLSLNDWAGAGAMKPVMYVRDQPGDSWVVHVRLIPTKEEVLWIRWMTRFGTLLSMPHWLSKLILSIPIARRALLYRAEARGGRPNIQAQPLARVSVGGKLSLAVRCEYVGSSHDPQEA